MEFEISNIIAIISVILVFLVVIVDLLLKKTELLLKKTKPLEKENSYKKELNSEFNKVIFKSILLTISYVCLLYILSPVVIKIIKTSILSFTEFDILRTLIIFFVVLLIVFFFISLRMVIILVKRKIEIFKR